MDDIAPRAHRGRRFTERLTDLKARRLAKPGRHSDGGGLFLFVSKAGNKSFVFVFVRDGRKRELGLGAYPGTSLNEARQKAKEHREALRAGKIPQSHQKAVAAAAMTFGGCCDRYLELSAPRWRENTAKAWRYSIGPRRCKALRAMSVAAIAKADVVQAIAPYGHEAQRFLLRRLAAVFAWAEAREYRPAGTSPAEFEIKNYLVLQAHAPRHQKALPWAELPAFMRGLQANGSLAAGALMLQIMTCVRPTEARLAQWAEVDFDAAVWTIPASRMKTKEAHRVPLATQTLALLRHMESVRSADSIFPGRNAALSHGAINKFCAPFGGCAHGFRSSFSDWSAQHGYPYELTEISLAHAFGSKVSQAYRRTDLIESRRALLQDWADFVCGAVT
jgi:integrase